MLSHKPSPRVRDRVDGLSLTPKIEHFQLTHRHTGHWIRTTGEVTLKSTPATNPWYPRVSEGVGSLMFRSDSKKLP